MGFPGRLTRVPPGLGLSHPIDGPLASGCLFLPVTLRGREGPRAEARRTTVVSLLCFIETGPPLSSAEPCPWLLDVCSGICGCPCAPVRPLSKLQCCLSRASGIPSTLCRPGACLCCKKGNLGAQGACWARGYTCACAVDTDVAMAPPQR